MPMIPPRPPPICLRLLRAIQTYTPTMRTSGRRKPSTLSSELVEGMVPVTWTLCARSRGGSAVSFKAVGIWEV